MDGRCLYEGRKKRARHVQEACRRNVSLDLLCVPLFLLTHASPEMMGLVSALVYLLAIIVFLPFAFKGDIVAATSGGGNKDVVLEAHQIETGRFLHIFPLEKVAKFRLVPDDAD